MFMKPLMTVLMILLCCVGFSQDTNKVHCVTDNIVHVVRHTEVATQSGYFIEQDGTLVKHGKWVLRSDGVVMKGWYDQGQLQKLNIKMNGEVTKYDQKDLLVADLKREVKSLQTSIALMND